MRLALLVVAVCAAMLLAPAARAQRASILDLPTNLGFEASEADRFPDGWGVVARRGAYQIETSDQSAEGERSLTIRFADTSPANQQNWAGVEQMFRAESYIGKRLRVSALLRTNGATAPFGAVVQLKIVRQDQSTAFLKNHDAGFVQSPDWQRVAIECDVPADAAVVVVSALYAGPGEAWYDGFLVEDLGAPPDPTPPADLTDQQLDHLVVFARIAGVVRHFHPSDAAMELDWDDWLVRAIPIVSRADSPAAFEAALRSVLQPIAPTMTIGVVATGAIDTSEARAKRRWEHHGYAEVTTQPGVYFRSLQVVPLGGEPDAAPPAEWSMQLPEGGSVTVPIVAHVDSGGASVPASAYPEALGRGPTSQTVEDRWVRLAGVIKAWNVIWHFHPYLELVAFDWRDALRPALAEASAAETPLEYERLLRRMLAEVQDGHIGVRGVRPAARYPLPIRFGWIDGELIAEKVELSVSKINAGDRIESIDGVPVQQLFEREARMISGSPQWIRVRALDVINRVPAETQPRIIATTPEGERHNVLVESRPGIIPFEERPDWCSSLADGVWYVDLTNTRISQLWDRLPQLSENAKAIVFDLRGYPKLQDPMRFFGHLVNETAHSPRWRVPFITQPDRQGIEHVERGRWTIEPREPFLDVPVAFITDGRAISYAESCLQVVQGNGIGPVIGSASAGANGNVIGVELPGGFMFGFTGMLVRNMDDSRHYITGVTPDIAVPPTREGWREGRDVVLEAAVDHLLSRIQHRTREARTGPAGE